MILLIYKELKKFIINELKVLKIKILISAFKFGLRKNPVKEKSGFLRRDLYGRSI